MRMITCAVRTRLQCWLTIIRHFVPVKWKSDQSRNSEYRRKISVGRSKPWPCIVQHLYICIIRRISLCTRSSIPGSMEYNCELHSKRGVVSRARTYQDCSVPSATSRAGFSIWSMLVSSPTLIGCYGHDTCMHVRGKRTTSGPTSSSFRGLFKSNVLEIAATTPGAAS